MRLGLLAAVWLFLNNVAGFGKDVESTCIAIVTFIIIALDVYVLTRNFRKGVYFRKFNTKIRKLSWVIKMVGMCIVLFTLYSQYVTQEAIVSDLEFKSITLNSLSEDTPTDGLEFMKRHSYCIPKSVKDYYICVISIVDSTYSLLNQSDIDSLSEVEKTELGDRLKSNFLEAQVQIAVCQSGLDMLLNVVRLVVAIYIISLILFYWSDIRKLFMKKPKVGLAEM